MEDFLNRKKHFQFSLSVWQIGAIAGTVLLMPYLLWEVFWFNQVGMAAIKLHTYIVLFAILFWLFIMPFSFFGFIRRTLMIGLVYLVLCLIIGEVHPFTKIPMYSKFVNYAYSFKLTDKNGNLIPLKTYYKITSADLSHKYYSIAQKLNLRNGFMEETPETLRTAGHQLLTELQETKIRNQPADTLCLYLVCHYLSHDSLLTSEKLMYADKARQ